MKALVVLIAIAATADLQAGADAPKVEKQAKIKQIDNKNVFRLVVKAPDYEPVRVTIVDDQDELVYSERLSVEKGFKRDYDLAYLPEGDYSVIVESKDYTYDSEITVNHWDGENLIISEVDGNVAVIGSNQSAYDLKVTIQDEDGKELYQEEVAPGSDLKHLFKFDEVDSDNIRILISDDYREIKGRMIGL